MSRKTTAIVANALGEPPRLEGILLDDIRADEAVVEIQAVGVCHADLAVLHGHIPLPFPRVLGHEGPLSACLTPSYPDKSSKPTIAEG